MRPSWHPGIRTTWHLLTMVLGLLLLLTYLLFQSRTPVPTHDIHFRGALQDIALYDVQLTRDVLLTRAGLLSHADSLVQTSHALLRALATLRPGSAEPSGDMTMVLRQQVDMLTTVLEQKLRLVEYFTADNALLQNSLLYVLHTGQVLPMQTSAVGQTPVGAEVGMLSHALLRLLQNPQSAAGTELLDILDRLPVSPFSSRNSISWPHTAGALWNSCRKWIRWSANCSVSPPHDISRRCRLRCCSMASAAKPAPRSFVCCCTSLPSPC